MAKISKPDANPILALILTFFFQLGHVLINGQKRKFQYLLVVWLLAHLACCIGGPIFAILSIIDAFQTAQRLQKGEEIDENEYTFAPLFKIMKMIDKTAVGPAA